MTAPSRFVILRQQYAALPDWRKPYGESIATSKERRARERRSMCSAVLDIVGGSALARDQITSGLREEWGECSESDVDYALRMLLRDGELRRHGDLYVGVDP